MSDLRKVAQQALELLEHHGGHLPWNAFVEIRKGLRAALAETVPSDCPDSHQPEPQPVAWTSKQTLTRLADFDGFIYEKGGFDDAVALYTSPPQRKPLTDQTSMGWLHRWANQDDGSAETEWQRGYDDARRVVQCHFLTPAGMIKEDDATATR